MDAASGPALLIALTGSPGEGRTRLLVSFATEAQRRGQKVDGFFAIAGPRPGPHRGADFYRLHLLSDNRELPWATRDETLRPPYRFAAATLAELTRWAKRLREQTRVDLLVLDEFGPFEVEGNGWAPVWEELCASAPRVVLMSVRRGCEDAAVARLGRPFDLVLPVSDPETPEKLRRACADLGEWTQIGLWGGAAGTLEMTLGSVLHATKTPFRGAALCSAQAGLLTFASAGLALPVRAAWVAFIAAGLKAFSPGGGRVRPMVAISVQGAFFATAVQVVGWNLAGLCLGGVMIGAWAALQGFLVQYLLLGEDLVIAYAKATEWLAERWGIATPALGAAIGAWALLHALLAGAAAGLAWHLRAPPQRLRDLLEKEAAKPESGVRQPRGQQRLFRRVVREFGRWQFWIPLGIVTAVLLATGQTWEGIAWLIIRFVAAGAVLFALLAFFQPIRIAAALRRRGWWGPAVAFTEAFQRRAPAPVKTEAPSSTEDGA